MKALSKVLMIWAGALLCGLPLTALPEDAAPSTGTWQKHDLMFSFAGFTTSYSCDGLADKLKLLLLAAGARKDVKSQPAACTRGFGRPDRFASAYLTFYTLATPGAGAPSDAPTAMGAWRNVKFVPRFPSQLQEGDCELLEQFRDRLLPLFAVRNLENRTFCVPHQVSDFSLSFDSFAAAEPKAGSVKGT